MNSKESPNAPPEIPISRRSFVQGIASAGALAALDGARLAAVAEAASSSRFVFGVRLWH